MSNKRQAVDSATALPQVVTAVPVTATLQLDGRAVPKCKHRQAPAPRASSRTSRYPAALDQQNLSELIALDDVSVDIHHTAVLRNLSFTLNVGEIAGIVGANGSGKTTLLELAATLRRPSAGRGCVLGVDVYGSIPTDVRRSICFVGHQAALYPQLTLRENLRFVTAMFGLPEDIAEKALSTVGLTRASDRRVEHCSQGMVRRADLARALMSRPTLLFLDEPHAGLDDTAAELVGFLVADVRNRGGAGVVVSHDRGRLYPIVDNVFELTEGTLIPARNS